MTRWVWVAAIIDVSQAVAAKPRCLLSSGRRRRASAQYRHVSKQLTHLIVRCNTGNLRARSVRAGARALAAAVQRAKSRIGEGFTAMLP